MIQVSPVRHAQLLLLAHRAGWNPGTVKIPMFRSSSSRKRWVFQAENAGFSIETSGFIMEILDSGRHISIRIEGLTGMNWSQDWWVAGLQLQTYLNMSRGFKLWPLFVSYKLRIIQIEPSKCSGLLGHLWRKMWRFPIRQTTCLVFGSRFQSACIQIENPSHMLFSPSNTVIYFLLFTMAGQNQMKKISVSSSFHARPPWCCSTGKSNQTITERGSCTREPWWPAPDPLSCNLCRNLAVHKPSWHLVHNYIILYIYYIFMLFYRMSEADALL